MLQRCTKVVLVLLVPLLARDAMALQAPAGQAAARENPADAEPRYWLGLAQAAQGDFRVAAESFESAAELRPRDEDALYPLQEVYLQLWKSTYERLVAANPDSFRIHQVLAEGYVQSNRLEDAKAEYGLVLRADPRITGVHDALGDFARRQKGVGNPLPHPFIVGKEEQLITLRSAPRGSRQTD